MRDTLKGIAGICWFCAAIAWMPNEPGRASIIVAAVSGCVGFVLLSNLAVDHF